MRFAFVGSLGNGTINKFDLVIPGSLGSAKTVEMGSVIFAAKAKFWAEVCIEACSGDQMEARARPAVQSLEKMEVKPYRTGCLLRRLEQRNPAVEKSTMGGMWVSESKVMVL